MQIRSCALIVTFPREEKSKLWLCLHLFLARAMLCAEEASGEECCTGSREGLELISLVNFG